VTKIDLAGKLALVTGGSRGIGRATCERLAAAGADVVVNYRASESDATATVAAIASAGGHARAIRADVSSAAEVEALFAEVQARWGALDVLVNNAGVIADALVAAMEPGEWDRVLEVDLRGAFLCTRAALPLMLPRHAGKIVNVGSVAAVRGGRGQSNYAAAKGGLVAFTRACAVELAPKGIQVNAVLPGMIETEMSARVRRRGGERLLAAIPAGRFGSAEEVAQVIAFLASPLADYVTGQALGVDGGMGVA
jgi:3-oxoacyl-[acyl-carrier protein] reductase